eukprot:m.277427 g.277427  ORF g.277427 m.277427 type:complete len:1170 (+) comp17706_c1_seq2:2-3511(+)
MLSMDAFTILQGLPPRSQPAPCKQHCFNDDTCMNCGQVINFEVDPSLEHISIQDLWRGRSIAIFESKMAADDGPLSEIPGYPSVRSLLWKCKELQQYRDLSVYCHVTITISDKARRKHDALREYPSLTLYIGEPPSATIPFDSAGYRPFGCAERTTKNAMELSLLRSRLGITTSKQGSEHSVKSEFAALVTRVTTTTAFEATGRLKDERAFGPYNTELGFISAIQLTIGDELNLAWGTPSSDPAASSKSGFIVSSYWNEVVLPLPSNDEDDDVQHGGKYVNAMLPPRVVDEETFNASSSRFQELYLLCHGNRFREPTEKRQTSSTSALNVDTAPKRSRALLSLPPQEPPKASTGPSGDAPSASGQLEEASNGQPEIARVIMLRALYSQDALFTCHAPNIDGMDVQVVHAHRQLDGGTLRFSCSCTAPFCQHITSDMRQLAELHLPDHLEHDLHCSSTDLYDEDVCRLSFVPPIWSVLDRTATIEKQLAVITDIRCVSCKTRDCGHFHLLCHHMTNADNTSAVHSGANLRVADDWLQLDELQRYVTGSLTKTIAEPDVIWHTLRNCASPDKRVAPRYLEPHFREWLGYGSHPPTVRAKHSSQLACPNGCETTKYHPQWYKTLVVGATLGVALVEMVRQVCVYCSAPVDSADSDHHLWFYEGPNADGIAVAVTVAMVCHFYADCVHATPLSFECMASKIQTCYDKAIFSGVSSEYITSDCLKKTVLSCLAALVNPKLGMTCCASPDAVAGRAAPMSLPTGVLSGSTPVDRPDCNECVPTPFPLSENGLTLVANGELRSVLRKHDLDQPKLLEMDALASNEQPSLRFILCTMQELLHNSNSSLQDYVRILEFLGSEASVTSIVTEATVLALLPLVSADYSEPLQAHQQVEHLLYSPHATTVVLETFPELSFGFEDTNGWRKIALATVSLAVSQASKVYSTIAAQAGQGTPCVREDHKDCRRHNQVHLYAGETMVCQTARRAVPRFQGLRDDEHAGIDSTLPCERVRAQKVAQSKSKCLLFLHVCLEHGAVCSFHLTSSHGSKDVVLPIFRSWATIPEFIVCEQACQTSTYALARMPFEFARTVLCSPRCRSQSCGRAQRLDGSRRPAIAADNPHGSLLDKYHSVLAQLDVLLTNAQLPLAMFLVRAVLTGLNVLSQYDEYSGSQDFALQRFN